MTTTVDDLLPTAEDVMVKLAEVEIAKAKRTGAGASCGASRKEGADR